MLNLEDIVIVKEEYKHRYKNLMGLQIKIISIGYSMLYGRIVSSSGLLGHQVVMQKVAAKTLDNPNNPKLTELLEGF